MYCPRCGSTQDQELRFCKACGANLSAVRKAIDSAENGPNSEPHNPWFAEMAISDADSRRRKEELDHSRGIAPELQRYNEIKGGIITGSAGLGVATFLYFFMQGLILSGNVSSNTGEILSRVWLAGLIPLAVGVGLIVNGVFIGKRLAEVMRRAAQTGSINEEKETNPLALPVGKPNEFISADYSVTDDTTRHLVERSDRQG